jgi:DNA (cytosine-5)-methyltransferase 1
MGLIIDNFAGGGGASTGIERGMGRKIDIAINHDEAAIAVHKANHPDTLHYCQSVWRADPKDVVKGREVDLAWFSPDCKHFSKAKGGKPVEKSIRDLAWVVVLWAKRVRPKVIMLENVEEFQTWGPIGEDGRPCPIQKGFTFQKWIKELRKCGYKVEWREMRACDYGAPTIRKRLFLIARCDGLPIVWPEATHGVGKLPYKTAGEIIDWDIPCPSIFGRKMPLKEATCRRIATGIMKYVVNAARPFIVPITHTKAGDFAYSVDAPLKTITTAKGGEFALVSAWIAQFNTGVVGRKANEPLSTIMMRGTQQVLVSSHILKLRNNCYGQPMSEPLDVITSGGLHFGEVRAFLCKYYGNDKDGQSLNEPCHTITTKERFGLIVVSVDGQEYAIADIGMRMLSARELARAQGFPDDYILDPICEYSTPSGAKKIGQLPKVHQIAKIGNSVCPIMAEVLTRANNPITQVNDFEVAA